MRAIVGKIAVVGVIAVGIYLSLVMLDITCPVGLKSCELYEPFSLGSRAKRCPGVFSAIL